ncbi:hypothetical protein DFQ01_106172 [Paenibacillus cellulosilyticus]|uniref:Uncharacterized protein n=1 Tax=Paenibacillus cellulosilyticus TaxID=375489 RepID=A0A2V2YV88_9BACL|nr:hypothetical protein [Paenibacillus cellulosilyticus]PWW04887.1 hypothetical protein DFQ01_106172 [Paenibacillus cellulosilyticus]QKS45993.1 hypothetical protein HUB94_17235 [Paenibacillus cellulosilyticus]
MGQRANLIILQNNRYELYYSHWCANTLPHDLFWGEQYAIPYIRMQTRVNESDWLDDVWAEGGVVVDLDQKTMLLYGGEDIVYDIPLRNLFLRLMSAMWKGWVIKWAFEGIATMADYVGYPRENVVAPRKEDSVDCSIAPPEEKSWTDLIVSVKFSAEEMLIFPVSGEVEPCLLNGEGLISRIDKVYGYRTLHTAEWSKRFPAGGLHIDRTEKRLAYWDSYVRVRNNTRIQSRWPGWEIVNFESDYESHAQLTEGRLHFHIADERHLLKEIETILLREPSNPLDRIVNPNAFHFNGFELPKVVKEELLTYAISQL